MKKLIYFCLLGLGILSTVYCNKDKTIDPVENNTPTDSSAATDTTGDDGGSIDLQVETIAISDITSYSAISGGVLSGSTPYIDAGICWSSDSKPSLNDNNISAGDTSDKFSLKILTLTPNSTYYLCAYAITNNSDTVYGDIREFNTSNFNSRSESNCYLSDPNDAVIIPVDRANKSDLGTQISSGDEVMSKLIWTDTIGVIDTVYVVGEGSSSHMVVLTGKSAGNAVVAAEINGKIVWSWHIWAMADTSSIGTVTLPSGSVIMDRNLGATSTTPGDFKTVGMQYQFGRMIPFPASASFSTPTDRKLYDSEGNLISIGLEQGSKSLSFAISNPLTFITTNGTGWCDQNVDWVNDNGSKSVLDPSPEGWKVAKLEDYTGLADDNFESSSAGEMFIYNGQSNYWPFTGYRDVNGTMDATANFGTFWVNAYITGSTTASFSPTYGLGGAQAINGAPAGRALSIRCVKE